MTLQFSLISMFSKLKISYLRTRIVFISLFYLCGFACSSLLVTNKTLKTSRCIFLSILHTP